MAKPSILFVCTGNCCRSQMAEGLMAAIAEDRMEVCSAGSHPTGYVHPVVTAAMMEIGIDIGQQRSEGLDAFDGRDFDYVVTVCDHARASCPRLAGRLRTYHWPIDDPISVQSDDDDEAMAAARRARDELMERVSRLLREIGFEPQERGTSGGEAS